MLGSSSGALKDGIALKVILAESRRGRGRLSAFAIRAWGMRIITAERMSPA